MDGIRGTAITARMERTLDPENNVRIESTLGVGPERIETTANSETDARIDSTVLAEAETNSESMPHTPVSAQSPSMLELFGTRGCAYTAELREELDFQGRAYVEHDVEADAGARARLQALAPGSASVPVLVEDGRVLQVGYRGRSCYVSPA